MSMTDAQIVRNLIEGRSWRSSSAARESRIKAAVNARGYDMMCAGTVTTRGGKKAVWVCFTK
jgi:hypothetical protein